MTPLRDGMNLVAKEYVARRTRRIGRAGAVKFAGAAEDLQEAITVNPYDTEEMAEGSIVPLRCPSRNAARYDALIVRVRANVATWRELRRAEGRAAALGGAGMTARRRLVADVGGT